MSGLLRWQNGQKDKGSSNGADLEKELKKAEDTVNFNMGQ